MRAALAFMPTSSAPDAAPVTNSASASIGTDVASPGSVVVAANTAQEIATARPP